MSTVQEIAAKAKNIYVVECRKADGSLRWREEVKNLVVNEGLDEMLNQFWKGSAYTASHAVGLLSGTPTIAPGDTMAAHAGWTEVQDYDEATREAYTPGAVSGQSVDNSASKASFTMNAGGTCGGAFVTTNNTKGGTTGILIAAAAFTGGNRAYLASDVINVTITATAASA